MIETWQHDHPAWAQLTQLIAGLEQSSWVAFAAEWHQSSHMLVAHEAQQARGYLRYVIQAIGVEQDKAPVILNGDILTEAKVLAFGVDPTYRRQGYGRALQQQLIVDATARGCYQIRSHSSAENIANHHLKLSLGYAIHPLTDDEKRNGAFFLMRL